MEASRLDQDDFASNRSSRSKFLLAHDPRFRALSRGQAFSDLPSPAEASSQMKNRATGFAQAGNRFPPRIKCGAGFFGIMR
jgi:hypothetical protein